MVDPLAQQRRRLVEDGAAFLDVGRAPFRPCPAGGGDAPRRGRRRWRKALGHAAAGDGVDDVVASRGLRRETHDVINPVTGGAWAKCLMPRPPTSREAIAASGRAWPEWRSTDVKKRGAILHKTAALLRERSLVLGAMLTQEQGKGPEGGQGRSAGSRAIVRLVCRRHQARLRPHFGPPRRPGTRHRAGRPDRDFSPWNFPIYLFGQEGQPRRSPPAAP